MSTKDPEVIESLRASCNGIGTDMTRVATSTILEVFEVRDELKEVATRSDLARAHGNLTTHSELSPWSFLNGPAIPPFPLRSLAVGRLAP